MSSAAYADRHTCVADEFDRGEAFSNSPTSRTAFVRIYPAYYIPGSTVDARAGAERLCLSRIHSVDFWWFGSRVCINRKPPARNILTHVANISRATAESA